MDKQVLEYLISENKSIAEIATHLTSSKGNTRYWLKKYNLKTNNALYNVRNVIENNHKTCTICKILKPIEDFHIKNKKGERNYYNCKCKNCFNQETNTRLKIAKTMFLEYKGGKCILCNYSKCIQALDFHHTDPTQKEFDIGQLKLNSKDIISINPIIKLELDKCVVLCSRCHREVHAGVAVLE